MWEFRKEAISRVICAYFALVHDCIYGIIPRGQFDSIRSDRQGKLIRRRDRIFSFQIFENEKEQILVKSTRLVFLGLLVKACAFCRRRLYDSIDYD